MKKDKFIFFTNINSQKGKELSENNNISACIFFEESKKQIRIEGKAFLESKGEVEQYFKDRPLISRIASSLSRQSDILPDYNNFVQEVYKKIELGGEISHPLNWVGFGILPYEFEFFESKEFRLNKREKYKKDLHSENLWNLFNLYP